MDQQDEPGLDIHDEKAFLTHLLERVEWQRDLHFETQTTIDTLDYSGDGLNCGSKVVIAARGPKTRELTLDLQDEILLPSLFHNPRLVMPGVLVIEGPPFTSYSSAQTELKDWEDEKFGFPPGIALVVIVDDSIFASKDLANWLWVTFTRSQPSKDVYGVGAFVKDKHWGCRGSLIIDARIKPHHAPPLVEDPAVNERVRGTCASYTWTKGEDKWMKFDQLQYFVETARRQHIGQAAVFLNISPSAISHSIASLEDELGRVFLKNQADRFV